MKNNYRKIGLSILFWTASIYPGLFVGGFFNIFLNNFYLCWLLGIIFVRLVIFIMTGTNWFKKALIASGN